MSELNVAIVGLGEAGDAHIQMFNAVNGVNVTAVCSRRQLDEKELERKYGRAIRAYQDFDAMLADDSIDIVDICTPHPFHANQAVAAAKAGKNLLIEKPIALSFKELVGVKKAVDAASVKVCIGFECRYSQHFQLVRSMIDQGLLGEVHYAEVDYFHGIGRSIPQYEWNIKKEFGGSSLLTAGCHAMDAMLYFMNAEPEEIISMQTKSQGTDYKPYEYNTTSVNVVRFKDSNKIAKVTSCIDALQPYHFHVHVIGSEGTIYDNKFYSERIKGMNKHKWSTLETSLIDSGDVHHHPYCPQFQTFVDDIVNNTNNLVTDLAAGLQTHQLVFAADKSAAEHRAVRLSELNF